MENDKLVKASDVKEYFKRVIFGADQKIDAWVDSIPAPIFGDFYLDISTMRAMDGRREEETVGNV